MPKFAPNTGFKMPGVGSKEIDSPSNFRDEQHVDKVGYCDTTEDSMLPKGSSPLKVRYTSSGYLKDLDAISIPVGKKSESKPKPAPSPTPEKKSKGSIEVPKLGDTSIKKPEKITVSSTTPGKTGSTRTKDTLTRKKTFNDMKAEGYSDAEIEEAKKYRKNNPDEKNIGFTTTTYTVNGKKTDKAGYDAAGPGANRTKS